MNGYVGGIYAAVPAGPTLTQLSHDFASAEGIRGIAFDGTYWYHAPLPNQDTITRETYPTRGSATTFYTGPSGAGLDGITTDGVNLYWIEQWTGEDIYSMPLAGGSPTSIYHAPANHLGSLVWHPTDGLLYFVETSFFGSGVTENRLQSMTTAGGSLATIYTSNHSTPNADDSHLPQALAPMSPSPGYLWGGHTPNGSTGHPGGSVYPLGGALTIGMRSGSGISNFGPVGLKSDTALYRLQVDAFPNLHISETTPAFVVTDPWPLEDPAMTSDISSAWSTHSADFSKTHFGAGGHIWEIDA